MISIALARISWGRRNHLFNAASSSSSSSSLRAWSTNWFVKDLSDFQTGKLYFGSFLKRLRILFEIDYDYFSETIIR